MGESLSHGVPVVSYDYLYGPTEMIKPGVNGELIALNDQAKFIKTVIQLLQDHAKLQQLSNGAYENLQPISAEHTWEQWQQIIPK